MGRWSLSGIPVVLVVIVLSIGVATAAATTDKDKSEHRLPYADCPATGVVSRVGQSSGTLDPEDAPTSAPSIAHYCTTQTSNARGRYTSTLAPCEFTFHTIEEADVELIDYQTSDLCSSDNGFLVMKEYVYDWGDECVGDFRRCYSLEHHRHLLFDFLCAMDWELPAGTTHVSVSCEEDKSQIYQHEKDTHQAGIHERTEERIETFEVKLVNLALILGSCLAGIYAISRGIVRPMVTTALQLEQQQPFTQSNNINSTSGSSASEEGDSRTSSGRWIPSQHFFLEVDQAVVGDGSDVDDCDGDSEDSEAQQRSFDLQVPADFDAIPIVAATVLPDLD